MSNEVAYIKSQLIESILVMKDAKKITGWTFPRIRSRAITICKNLKGTFEKVERGVYMFQPTPPERLQDGKE